MKKTWIVVANSSKAIIYRALNALGALEPVANFEHPESRSKNRDLLADSTKSHKSRSHSASHDAESLEPKEQEAVRFALELSRFLAQGRCEQAYERLIVIASPHFKGLLLARLDPETAKRVEKTLDKDLTHEEPRTLAARLAEFVRFAA